MSMNIMGKLVYGQIDVGVMFCRMRDDICATRPQLIGIYVPRNGP